MLFELGQIVATPAALEILQENGIEFSVPLIMHSNLHCPELCAEDQQANRDAVEHGDRVLSHYTINGNKLFVITEWDRSVTTILLADEY